MDNLEKFKQVNKTKTLEELAGFIRGCADELGMIQGRTRKFDANRMAYYCENLYNFSPNLLTREFGIRQQAIYILYYENKLNEKL